MEVHKRQHHVKKLKMDYKSREDEVRQKGRRGKGGEIIKTKRRGAKDLK